MCSPLHGTYNSAQKMTAGQAKAIERFCEAFVEFFQAWLQSQLLFSTGKCKNITANLFHCRERVGQFSLTCTQKLKIN